MQRLYRPCIDIHQGRVKQIVGSTLGKGKGLRENFISPHQPLYYAKLYSNEKLTGGHIVMLTQTEKDKALVKEILQQFPGTYSLGGGMSADNALEWIRLGAKKVIFSSFIFSHPLENWLARLNQLKSILKKNQMIIDLSCTRKGNKYFVAVKQWKEITALEINRKNLNSLSQFASEFLIHSIDKEGKRQGIDLDLIKTLAEISPLNCVYGGGVVRYQDIEDIKRFGRGKVFFTVGSGLDLFGGDLNLSSVVKMSKISF